MQPTAQNSAEETTSELLLDRILTSLNPHIPTIEEGRLTDAKQAAQGGDQYIKGRFHHQPHGLHGHPKSYHKVFLELSFCSPVC